MKFSARMLRVKFPSLGSRNDMAKIATSVEASDSVRQVVLHSVTPLPRATRPRKAKLEERNSFIMVLLLFFQVD
jgi:hypothetical protein